MKKNNLSEIIGVIISLAGIVVIIGWFLNIGFLKSILPAWVSMKFSTALAFVFSGVELYFIARFLKQDQELAVIIIPIMSMLIFLLMASLLASTVMGVSIGVEEMFIKDSMIAVKSVIPGRPSIATMLSFIFIGLCGILISIDIKKLNRLISISGIALSLIGFAAILGYSINQSLLYFMVLGKSSAMAMHTAILFVLWGIGLFLTRKNS